MTTQHRLRQHGWMIRRGNGFRDLASKQAVEHSSWPRQCGPAIDRGAVQQISAKGVTDATVHVAGGSWCVHFVITTTQTPIGPWLLFGSSDEIRVKVFTWGNVTTEQVAQSEIDLRRWGIANVHMNLADQQLHTLVERKHGRPWSGYELIKMRNASKYRRARLTTKSSAP
jgi:hypothetical protein